MKYSSEAETRKHIQKVGYYLLGVIQRLTFRITGHDESKLEEPEKSIFDKYTPKLADSTYGSKQYKKFLDEMKPALQVHYTKNRHHPEHHFIKNNYGIHISEEELEEYDLGETEKWDNKEEKIRKVD